MPSPGSARAPTDRDLATLLDSVLTPFGALIYRLRTHHHWTQQQLGDAAGVHHDTVMQLENGGGNPNIETCLRLLFPFGLVLGLVVAVNPQPLELTRLHPASIPPPPPKLQP